MLEKSLAILPGVIAAAVDGKKFIGMKNPVNAKRIKDISRNVAAQDSVQQVLDEAASNINILRRFGTFGRLIITLGFAFADEAMKEEDKLDEEYE